MKFNEKMKFSERLVYYIMQNKMKNYKIKFNEQQSNGEVDFELSSPFNEYTVPVEVTNSVDKGLMEMYGVLKKNVDFVRKEGRKCCWIIELTKSAKIKKIKDKKDKIDDFFYLLEKEKIQEFDCSTMMQYSKDIINKIKDINIKKYIDSATSIGFKEKGSIYILLPTDCCWLDEDRIITSVNNEFRPDNIRKLNTGIKEKHFFIYIDNTNFSTWCSIIRIIQPQTLCKTDIKNLTIWVVALKDYKCIIWKGHNNSKWERDEIFIPYDIFKCFFCKGR